MSTIAKILNMTRIIISLNIFLFCTTIVFSQTLSPQEQSVIDEYQANIENYKARNNQNGIVNSLIKMSNIYSKANLLDQAITKLTEAENLLGQSVNYSAKSQIYSTLGYLYLRKSNYISAEKYFQNAYDISINTESQATIMSLLLNIAQCQSNQGNNTKAISSYKEAFTIALETDNIQIQKNASAKLAICYKKIGDTENYTYYYNLSVKFDNLEKEEIIQNKENEAQRQRIIANQNALSLEKKEFENKKIKDSLSIQQQLNKKNQENIALLENQKVLQDSLIKHREKELNNEKKLLKAQRRLMYFLWAIIAVFGVGLIIILILLTKNKKQKQALDVNNKQLLTLNKDLSNKNKQINKQAEILNKQNVELESINKKISDSINYASRIQQAILPFRPAIENDFAGAFIFYRPRDIVSGDFYWYHNTGQERIIAAIDCTGHSVPGAFMSMIANTLLNEIIKAKNETRLNIILSKLNKGIIETLNNTNSSEEINDGMDISLLKFHDNSNKVKFASANHFAIIFNNEGHKIIDGDFYSIGGMKEFIDVDFTEQEIELEKNSIIYLFSDGFIDQFNKKGKKYMTKRFVNFLGKIHKLPPNKQEQKLSEEFDDWKKETRQLDDVLVIGILN